MEHKSWTWKQALLIMNLNVTKLCIIIYKSNRNYHNFILKYLLDKLIKNQ